MVRNSACIVHFTQPSSNNVRCRDFRLLCEQATSLFYILAQICQSQFLEFAVRDESIGIPLVKSVIFSFRQVPFFSVNLESLIRSIGYAFVKISIDVGVVLDAAALSVPVSSLNGDDPLSGLEDLVIGKV